MSSKKVAFHSYQLGERGTEVHMYNLAKYNREILGNESIIISTNTRPTPSLPMFEKEFEVFLYDDVWQPHQKNEKLRNSLDRICEQNKVSHLWATKGGEDDKIFPDNVVSIASCIFAMSEPHGSVYSGICKYISEKHGGLFPYIYPIIEDTTKDYMEDMRLELNIPKDALVLGRHGGKDSFSLQFAKQSIYYALSLRNDLHFVFLNTDKFIEHPRVHYLDWTSDFMTKTKFINTCDAMIHARMDGEIFRQCVAEFSIKNKPIITWKPDVVPSFYDTGHLYVIGENGFFYKDGEDLLRILLNISKRDFENKDWDVYKNTYSPESVMKDFEKFCLI